MRLVVRQRVRAARLAGVFGVSVLLLSVVCPYLSQTRAYLWALELVPPVSWLVLLAIVGWYDDAALRGKLGWWLVAVLSTYVACLSGWSSISVIRFSFEQFVFGVVVGFPVASVVYFLVSRLLLTGMSKLRRFAAANECHRCGYLLTGLTKARCPECGMPFDPSRIKEQAPPAAGGTITS